MIKASVWVVLCASLVWQARELISEAQAEYAIRNATTIEELNAPRCEGSFRSELAKKRGDYWRLIVNPAQLERALPEYRLAVEADPNDSSHWLDLAEIYRAIGKTHEAGEAFAVADALDPNNHQVQLAYGNYLLYQGTPDQALIHHARAVHLSSSLARNIYPLYWSLGVTPLQVADGLLDNNPDLSRQYWNDALTTFQPEEAERLWQRFLKTPGLMAEISHLSYFDYLVSRHEAAAAGKLWGKIARDFYRETWDAKKEAFWNGDLKRELKFPGGLEWVVAEACPPGSAVSIETDSGAPTTHTLRIAFAGTHNLTFSHVHHDLLLEPGKAYRLSFHVEARGITTHNGPYLSLAIPGATPVNQRSPVVTGTGAWAQELEFTAPEGALLGQIRICRDFSNKFDNKIGGEIRYSHFDLQIMSQ